MEFKFFEQNFRTKFPNKIFDKISWQNFLTKFPPFFSDSYSEWYTSTPSHIRVLRVIYGYYESYTGTPSENVKKVKKFEKWKLKFLWFHKNHIFNEFKNIIIFFRFPAKLRGFFRNRLKIDLLVLSYEHIKERLKERMMIQKP